MIGMGCLRSILAVKVGEKCTCLAELHIRVREYSIARRFLCHKGLCYLYYVFHTFKFDFLEGRKMQQFTDKKEYLDHVRMAKQGNLGSQRWWKNVQRHSRFSSARTQKSSESCQASTSGRVFNVSHEIFCKLFADILPLVRADTLILYEYTDDNFRYQLQANLISCT